MKKYLYLTMSKITFTLFTLFFAQILLFAQTSKSVNQPSSDDPNDIVFVFHQVDDSSFPSLPSPDNEDEIRLFYKNLGFWLSSNAEVLNQQISSNQLKRFTLKRSAIHQLESAKQANFKKFYNQLEGYIQFIINQRSISKGHIILPPSVFQQLTSFFN
jgi:hypothetical protein